MLDTAALRDLRGYIKQRITYAKYKADNVFYRAELNDVSINADGTVRAQLSIIPETLPTTITRVELWSSANELWCHKDVRITISSEQTGALYWFDFTVTEQEV